MTIDAQEAHFWVVIRTWAKPGPKRPHGESWNIFADRVDTEPELVALQSQYEEAVFHLAKSACPQGVNPNAKQAIAAATRKHIVFISRRARSGCDLRVIKRRLSGRVLRALTHKLTERFGRENATI
jgi:hypothetical protein